MRTKKTLKILGVVTLTAVIVLIIWLYRAIYVNPLPQTIGDIAVEGISNVVIISRDEMGIPTVSSSGERNLFFGQGFVHAQDRLWQMELTRRAAAGRLSELFGEAAVETDRLLRIFGFEQVVREEANLLSGESRALVEAYVAGVNAGIREAVEKKPPEFFILGHTPEAWRIEDCLLTGKLMALLLSQDMTDELLRFALVEKIGADAAADFYPSIPPENPNTLTYRGAAELLSLFERSLSMLPANGFASNAWVVSGEHTASGKPLFANDPHLQLNMPAIWYLVRLEGGRFSAEGASLAGIPGVIIGNNGAVAWGVTAAMVDVQDLFVVNLDTSSSSKYLNDDVSTDFEVRSEIIKIKGGEHVEMEVRSTVHGPVIGYLEDGSPIALSWTALHPNRTFESIVEIMTTGDVFAFKETLRGWSSPELNFVFADTMGNIGYQLAAGIPLRQKENGRTTHEGWSGIANFDLLPGAVNPESGYIVTANNRIVPEEYPLYLATHWMPGYRARRITDLLESFITTTEQSGNGGIDMMDFMAIQRDVLNLAAIGFIGELEGSKIDESMSIDAFRLLKQWDGELTAESTAGAIYEVLLYTMAHNTFDDELGDINIIKIGAGTEKGISGSLYNLRGMESLIRKISNPDDRWFDNVVTEITEDREDILAKSIRESVDFLTEKLGEDMKKWNWGDLHRLTFRHALGAVSPLDLIFNRGGFGMGGDSHTVMQSAYNPSNPYEVTSFAVSYRQVIDLSNLRNSVMITTTGQSGVVGSRHYDDQLALWKAGKYVPMKGAEDDEILRLVPTGSFVRN